MRFNIFIFFSSFYCQPASRCWWIDMVDIHTYCTVTTVKHHSGPVCNVRAHARTHAQRKQARARLHTLLVSLKRTNSNTWSCRVAPPLSLVKYIAFFCLSSFFALHSDPTEYITSVRATHVCVSFLLFAFVLHMSIMFKFMVSLAAAAAVFFSQ